jgi:DtxR family Mn-dependent transcriptional regulator
MPSLSEENYLKAIFVLNRQQTGSASTNAIAHRMNTKASSVTVMLKKLSQQKLVDYQKYQAAELTESGKKVAISVIRKHRLWEYFLVKKLDFNWDEVHDIAEQLEHIQSTELTDRLEKFLGYPTLDPHGDPIPDKKGNFPNRLTTTLSDGKEGEKQVVIGVKDHSSAFFNYLKSQQINLGSAFVIKKINEFDQSMEIELSGDKQNRAISHEVAKNLYVKHAENV